MKKVGQKVFRGCEKHGDEDGESSGESLVKKIEFGGEKVVKKIDGWKHVKTWDFCTQKIPPVFHPVKVFARRRFHRLFTWAITGYLWGICVVSVHKKYHGVLVRVLRG